MADIKRHSQGKVFKIAKWTGLNESPDGDVHMELGEAASMRNFRITSENHLQIRPGYHTFATLAEGEPVAGMWSGYVAGKQHLVAACGGKLWDITEDGTAADKGAITTDGGHVFMFGFSERLYILTGKEYYSWDGEGAPAPVSGYIPLVSTATPPAGGGTLVDGINLLQSKRKIQFSPDGKESVYHLPEKDIDAEVTVEGSSISHTVQQAAGTVTFSSAPPLGVNTITITYSKQTEGRAKVVGMRYAELFNGESDSRVFLYGNGTNEAVYSGLDDKGLPSAEYFPAFNTLAVDSANTPITAMIRHYDRLLVFKSDSAYSCAYSTLDIGGITTAAFRLSSLNRAVGNEAPGQARLIKNDARTVSGRSVYDWGLASNSVRDERNAKRISDRVARTLGSFDVSKVITYDDEWNQEYYIMQGNVALVHNYQVDAWYYYTNWPANSMVAVGGRLFFGTPAGQLMEVGRRWRNDNLQDIDAYWESGSMDFDMDWRRKYSANMWVSMKPEAQGRVTVTAQSNRKSDYIKKVISCGIASFRNASFAHWSFGTNRKPQVYRTKMKVKKFTFYKLIFSSISSSATATILATDFQIRYTGNVK